MPRSSVSPDQLVPAKKSDSFRFHLEQQFAERIKREAEQAVEYKVRGNGGIAKVTKWKGQACSINPPYNFVTPCIFPIKAPRTVYFPWGRDKPNRDESGKIIGRKGAVATPHVCIQDRPHTTIQL